MNSSYQVRLILAFLFSLFAFPSLLIAQTIDSLSSQTGYLNISSNYDSVFVIIDDDLKSARKLSNQDLLDISPGNHQITVITEFSPLLTFNEHFISDTVLLTRINFTKILNKRTELYRRLSGNDSLSGNLDLIHKDGRNFPRSFSTEFKSIDNYLNSQDSIKGNTWVRIKSNVDSLYVRNNFGFRQDEVIKIGNGDSVLIKPGNRLIEISHPNSEEWRTTKKITADSTTTIQHNFELRETSSETLKDNFATIQHYDANLFVISDDDSEIFIDDKFVGMGAVKLKRKTGPADIRIKNPYTGTNTYTAKITNLPSEDGVVATVYSKPDRRLSQIRGLIPGLSQFYKQQKFKSTLLSGGFLVLGGLTLQRNHVYNKELSKFRKVRENYNNATNERLAFKLGNKLDRRHKIVKKRDNERLVLFTLTSLVYAFNLYDALFDIPVSGFRDETDIEFYFQSNSLSNQTFTSMTLKYAF
ncbi:DUF5683 domain-containing protein [Gracilimonas sp.]|uniref:DUF5683 domain-containing protein n=1 Tax=Gracilimonas sp. TaxID=1974203 RepID=UPI003D0CD31D